MPVRSAPSRKRAASTVHVHLHQAGSGLPGWLKKAANFVVGNKKALGGIARGVAGVVAPQYAGIVDSGLSAVGAGHRRKIKGAGKSFRAGGGSRKRR